MTNNSECYLSLKSIILIHQILAQLWMRVKIATVSLTIKYNTYTLLTNLTPFRNICNPYGIYHHDLTHLTL